MALQEEEEEGEGEWMCGRFPSSPTLLSCIYSISYFLFNIFKITLSTLHVLLFIQMRNYHLQIGRCTRRHGLNPL